MAPKGATPKAPGVVSTCVSPTQHRISWPRSELHLRPQWRCPHASPPPTTAFRGPVGSFT
eukprot:4200744-Pyramimonas_sp.AAC.1